MNKRQGRREWHVIAWRVVLLALPFLYGGCNHGMQARHEGQSLAASEDSIKTNPVMVTNQPMTVYPIEEITPDMLLGKVDPSTHELFVVIDARHASRSGMLMHRQAYEAFVEMHQAALRDGVNLTIVSAMRTFDHQKRIWNNKWNGITVLQGNVLATDIADPVQRALEILRFSAMPGTSRHHWGTDIDLNSLQNEYFLSGEGRKIYDWLKEHAGRYGFFQPYTAHGQGREGGYEEEKWHWSYHPVASPYLAAYQRMISYDMITGFEGWQTARPIDVISNYVMQVSSPE